MSLFEKCTDLRPNFDMLRHADVLTCRSAYAGNKLADSYVPLAFAGFRHSAFGIRGICETGIAAKIKFINAIGGSVTCLKRQPSNVDGLPSTDVSARYKMSNSEGFVMNNLWNAEELPPRSEWNECTKAHRKTNVKMSVPCSHINCLHMH